LWLSVIPVSLAAWSIVMVIRNRFATRCPACGSRMRPRDGTDPESGRQTLCFDCEHCKTEWISDEFYTNTS
jgi:hypothetical protein